MPLSSKPSTQKAVIRKLSPSTLEENSYQPFALHKQAVQVSGSQLIAIFHTVKKKQNTASLHIPSLKEGIYLCAQELPQTIISYYFCLMDILGYSYPDTPKFKIFCLTEFFWPLLHIKVSVFNGFYPQ